ncbi:MAG: hypothetical protein F7C09_02720 [Aeropyrum sp.]|nr:hypothetical protein [Aeropyrum sp.]
MYETSFFDLIPPPYLYALIVLAMAGASDALYREVDPPLWYIGSKAGILLFTLTTSNLDLTINEAFMALQGILVVIAAYILYRLCMLGGADVAALIFILFSTPLPLHLPISPIAASLALSAPALGAYLAFSSLKARRSGWLAGPEDLVVGGRFKWWLPKVQEFDLSDNRKTCALDYDPPAVLVLSSRDRARVEPGLPLVAFISLGYMLYLVVELALAL